MHRSVRVFWVERDRLRVIRAWSLRGLLLGHVFKVLTFVFVRLRSVCYGRFTRSGRRIIIRLGLLGIYKVVLRLKNVRIIPRSIRRLIR